MKRWISLLLVFAMAFSLCGGISLTAYADTGIIEIASDSQTVSPAPENEFSDAEEQALVSDGSIDFTPQEAEEGESDDSSAEIVIAEDESAGSIVLDAKDASLAESTDGKTVLAFTSDIHNAENNTAANRLNSWLNFVQEEYGRIDAMSFCGDMGSAFGSGDSWWSYVSSVKNVVDGKNLTGIYTTGNHEFYNGSYSSTSNATKNIYKVDQEGLVGSNFRIYCLGSDNWNNNRDNYTLDQITALTGYLDSVGNDCPIIILTHYPLHHYGSRTTTNADRVIDVLNAASSSGKKIVLLWGHNHSVTDSNYDEIFEPGRTIQYGDSGSNTKEIQFFYGAAGCMSDSEYGSGSAYVKGKGLVITIDHENKLSFTYYDAYGNDVTEGGTYTEQDPVPVESVTIEEATEPGDDGQPVPVAPTVVTGKKLQLHYVTVPETATVKSITWSSSDPSVATVDNTGNVKGVSPGKATITVTVSDGITRATVVAAVEVEILPRTGNEPAYVLTDTLEAGRNYVIANKNSGEAYALTNDNGSVAATAVEIIDDVIYADDENIVFAAQGNDTRVTDLENDGHYLTVSSASPNLSLNASAQGRVWTFNGASHRLSSTRSGGSSTAYYIRYSSSGGNFTASSSNQGDIYLFAEVTEEVAVTGLELSPAALALKEGETGTLTAAVEPENASNKKVSWSSSDETVATVENGIVTAVAEGTATITARTVDGGFEKTCTVTVTEAPKVNYILTDTLEAGREYLIATSNNGSGFILSDESGSVSNSLKGYSVEAADGRISITTEVEEKTLFECEQNPGSTDPNYVRLKIDGRYLYADGSGALRMIDSISDSGKNWHYRADKSLLWFFNGTSEDYGYTATGSYKYYLVSDNDGNFTKGIVQNNDRLIEASTPAIYLFVKDDSTPQPVINVEGVTLDRETETVEAGTTVKLTATIVPSDATNKSVTWISSDVSVAAVSNGIIMGIAEGTATIAATTVDGGFTDTCEVTVLAHEHTYGAPTYEWASDNSTCTATITCTGCEEGAEGHSITETVTSTRIVTDPTCTEDGYTICTAIFSNAAFSTQIRKIDGEAAMGHTPNEAVHENEVAATCTEAGSYDEVVYCSVCGNEISRETVEIPAGHSWNAGTITTEPTCTEAGEIIYTCTVCGETKEETIAALGHDWEFEGFTWTGNDADGYTAAAANYSCRNNEAHTATMEATVTESVIDPDCETPGRTTYTAAVTAADSPDETDHSESRDIKPTEPTGHVWGGPSWIWARHYRTATATFTCENNPEHTVAFTDEEIEIVTEGSISTYIASVTGPDGSVYTDTAEVYLSDVAYLAFTSDVHNNYNNNISADRLENWIYKIKHEFLAINFIGFCGDMGISTIYGDMAWWSCVMAVIDRVTASGIPAAYTTGNHEYDSRNGNYANSNNPAKSYFTENAVPENGVGENYLIYCMGSHNDSTGSYPDDQIAMMSEFLSGVGSDKPIIIMTHYPLHYSSRRTIANAGAVIDALNTASLGKDGIEDTADDRTIVFLWGHNHTFSDAQYGTVLEPGDNIRYSSGASSDILFYYAAAGCMADGEFNSGSAGTLVKGLVITIAPNDALTFKYYTRDDIENGSVDHPVTKTEAVEATCTAEGSSEYYTCSICGKYFSDAEGTNEIEESSWVIQALGHTCSDWTVTTEPTCTEAGEETGTCDRCGVTVTREVEALGHDWGDWIVTTFPTCTEPGIETRICANDESHRETREVKALGHEMTAHPAVDTTCIAAGSSEYWTCSVCGKYFSDAEGKTEIEKDSWVIPATGHTTGEAVIENTIDPSCTEAGSYDEVVYCTMCKKELERKTVEIPALGHTPVTDAAIAPTCTETGLTEGSHCSVCGEVFAAQETLPAAGHKAGEKVLENETAATCEKDGSYDEVIYCTVCHEELSRTTVKIEALGHDWSDWTVTKEPTCTANGATSRICSRGDAVQTRPIQPLGHDWGDWTLTTEPTCTEAGVEMRVCANDESHKETREVKALGHEMTAHPAVDATCTAAGSSEYWTCSVCGKYFSDAEGKTEIGKDSWVVPATGHTTVTDAAIAPTCTETGLTEGSHCSVCGEVLAAQEVVSAKGHAWGEPAWTWATDCSTATATFTCGNDAEHTEMVDAEVTSEQSGGLITYTAKVTFNEIEYTDRKEIQTIKLKHNCEFDSNIALHYLVAKADLEGCDSVWLEIDMERYEAGASTPYSDPCTISNWTDYTLGGAEYCHFVFPGIFAAEMGNRVTAHVMVEKDGETVELVTDEYSVSDYAYSRLQKSNQATYKTLMVDMLNYGSAAQIHFNKNAAHPVNEALTDAQKALGTQTDPEARDMESTDVLEGATAEINGKNLVFGSSVYLLYRMKFAEDQDMSKVKIAFRYVDKNGNTRSQTVKASNFGTSNEFRTADCTIMIPSEMRSVVSATIYDGSTPISSTLNYSIETYVHNRLAPGGSDSATYKALLTEMLKYGISAEIHFG